MASLGLDRVVADYAEGMKAADERRPVATSHRGDRSYQPGIGPHREAIAVDLVVAELKLLFPNRHARTRTSIPYPASRQTCDLAIGETPEWAVEVKMARFSGDNGKPDDTAIKDILSPYECDRSALTDCSKLVEAGFPQHTAILIYGFDDARRPLAPIVNAFESLARRMVQLSPRQTARLEDLVHPVFASGEVFGWEIRAR